MFTVPTCALSKPLKAGWPFHFQAPPSVRFSVSSPWAQSKQWAQLRAQSQKQRPDHFWSDLVNCFRTYGAERGT